MKRTDKLRARLAEKGIDALLVTSELNQRYLCGYPFTDGVLLITKTRAIMLTDFRYYEEAQKKAFSEFEIEMPETRIAFITDALKNENAKTLGYENETLSCADFQRYSERLSEFTFAPIGGMLEAIREIKDPEELGAKKIRSEIIKHVAELFGCSEKSHSFKKQRYSRLFSHGKHFFKALYRKLHIAVGNACSRVDTHVGKFKISRRLDAVLYLLAISLKAIRVRNIARRVKARDRKLSVYDIPYDSKGICRIEGVVKAFEFLVFYIVKLNAGKAKLGSDITIVLPAVILPALYGE